jgi:hypothetical protein
MPLEIGFSKTYLIEYHSFLLLNPREVLLLTLLEPHLYVEA